MNTPRRLLILDDERTVAQTAAFAAERHGFEVRFSDSAKEFFDEIARFAPSHVIIDLLMPGMDGVEVLRNLAVTGCDANIIMMSGVDAKVLESAQWAGLERGLRISGILAKPFKSVELHALLDLETREFPGVRAAAEPGGEVSPGGMDAALRTGQFELYYQPKIKLVDGRPAGVEALVRWRHPSLGLLVPDRFLPALERSGNMDMLTRRVIEMGLAWFAEAGRGNALKLAINIAGGDLTDVLFTDVLNEQCTFLDIDPARVILEITETSSTRHTAETMDILTRMRLKGFQLSMDDFGSGYSSLMQLAKLPFSEIKIDKAFVGTMLISNEAHTIVTNTIRLGQALGLTTVAEGVESEAQARALAELECDQAQGYYFAEPMDGESAQAWLRERHEQT